jgi:hypothetical protein
MYGVGGRGRSVVYVIDASGSMVDAFPFVIEELTRSMRRLGPEQKFDVIFFQGDKAIAVPVPKRGLKVAKAENLKKVTEWIDPASDHIVPRGSSNPIAAIEQAIKLRPGLVYILSDNITGQGKHAIDQQTLLEAIDKAIEPTSRRIQINTIQFIHHDELGTLEQIARRHGGRFRFVDSAALAK